MKKNTNNVHCLEEHIPCKHFMQEDDSLFDFIQFDHADVYKSRKGNLNSFIFFISGDFELIVEKRKTQSVMAGFMCVISGIKSYQINCSSNSKMMVMYFNITTSACSKAVFYSYSKYVSPTNYKDTLLPIKPSISAFIKLLLHYVSDGLCCAHLFELKRDELFLALRWFYSKEELGHLFYSVVKDSCSFRRFVLDNYMKFENVTQMIKASNMSKSAFYEKFKKIFSVSVKQWMLSRQKQQMLRKAAEPDMTAKALMNEFNFSSPAHLTTFCKKQFGLTPTDLLRKYEKR